MRIKRLARITAWVIGGLVGLLFLLTAIALTTVDHTPYRALPVVTNTLARLEQAKATNHLVYGELRAGFGRAKLTPTLGVEREAWTAGRFRSVPLAGYGARKGKPATGVLQDVWVKAVAFAVSGQTSVIVAAEALIIPRDVADKAAHRLAEAKGLARELIYFNATHTHSSIGGWGQGYMAEQFAGPFVPGVPDWFAQQLAAAALAALDDLRPASLGHGSFAAPEFVRNRLVGDAGTKDPTFTLMLVKQADGDQAVLGSYAAHGTVFSGSNMQFNGDYPGYWAAALEKAGYKLGMFVGGSVASHGPRARKSGLEGAEQMGGALADLAQKSLPHILLTNQLVFGIIGVEVPLPELQVRLSDGIRLRPWLARALLPAPSTFVQGLRLQNNLWLSAPCDFSGELTLELKDQAKSRQVEIAVTSFNGDYVGYVIPSKYYHRDGYEPRLMSFYGPQLPDYLKDVLGGLVNVLAPSPEVHGELGPPNFGRTLDP
ncbi:MAG TPA: neutral/alkaline non-lysosomal ceramidase N-terminal domain-containing protein [Verrucomicrobiae bacterium]|nr:neutral/alkaline non-lysosomal ceramidase N-terminal domain-containing protein [Verrucomicrobiae bacterium]